MILYNVTIQVDPSIQDDWLIWMKEEHIPDVMSTGCFTEFRFWRLVDLEESSGPTFAAQYIAGSNENYSMYIERFAPEMRKRGYEKWGDRFIAFRTVMEQV
ncbi:MAG: DUF4286 family protein [Bacteroidota bacterium]|jgi:hypothetical protein